MENLRRWINYDWFKLIVALILLVIFIILLLQPPSPKAVAGGNVSPAATATSPAASQPTAPPAGPAAAAPTASPVAPSPTVLQPTATTQPEPTQTPSPTPAPTQSPTATPQAQQPAAPASPSTATGDCSKALPTRLEVGKKARVVYELNLRAEPGMDKKITSLNPPGAGLDIIGGPVCIPYGSGTYRWWNVKLTNGTTGWSAEGSLAGKRYFLEPVP